MAENQVNINTMTIPFSEYKSMVDEVSNLKLVTDAKNAEVSAAKAEAAVLRERLDNEKSKQNTIYVSEMPGWCGKNSVRLEKSSPEIEKIINNSIEKSQIKVIEKLEDQVKDLEKLRTKEVISLREKNEEKVKQLNEQLKKLTEDYENLKLDKANSIIEAERIKEINDLKEQISILEQEAENKESEKDFTINGWLLNLLFGKRILKEAKRIATIEYNRLSLRKAFSRIDELSAIGKGKEYLKKFQNDEKNTEHNNKQENKSNSNTTYSYGFGSFLSNVFGWIS